MFKLSALLTTGALAVENRSPALPSMDFMEMVWTPHQKRHQGEPCDWTGEGRPDIVLASGDSKAPTAPAAKEPRLEDPEGTAAQEVEEAPKAEDVAVEEVEAPEAPKAEEVDAVRVEQEPEEENAVEDAVVDQNEGDVTEEAAATDEATEEAVTVKKHKKHHKKHSKKDKKADAMRKKAFRQEPEAEDTAGEAAAAQNEEEEATPQEAAVGKHKHKKVKAHSHKHEKKPAAAEEEEAGPSGFAAADNTDDDAAPKAGEAEVAASDAEFQADLELTGNAAAATAALGLVLGFVNL